MCHSSCSSCTADAASTCVACAAGDAATKTADGAACLCNDGSGVSSNNYNSCAPCHSSCLTCGNADASDSCRSCAIPGATLVPLNTLGECACRDGYVPNAVPVGSCQACQPSGCPHCKGIDESECLTLEQIELLKYYQPSTSKSADNRICFYTELLTWTCTPDPIEYATEPILEYTTDAQPTYFQCLKLFSVQWPFVTFWFDQLFPNVVRLTPISSRGLQYIKSTLYLWIMQFGPAEMNTWTDIKALFNGAPENWTNYLAWLGADDGFTLDAGATVKTFPPLLLARLKDQCGSDPGNCDELFIFNRWSSVCDNLLCLPNAKNACTLLDTGGDCQNS